MECSSAAGAKGTRVIMTAEGKLFDHGSSLTYSAHDWSFAQVGDSIWILSHKKLIPPAELRLVGDQLGGFWNNADKK